MSSLINPAIARLGVTRVWVINYPLTMASNTNRVEAYRVQSYLYCLENACNWIFVNKFRKSFYMFLFIIYDKINLNYVGFPGMSSKLIVRLSFFDFFAHVHNFTNYYFLLKLVRKAYGHRYNAVSLSKHLLNLNFGAALPKLYKFLYKYIESLIIVRKLFKNYYLQFNSLLQKTRFKRSFIRIHRYFFDTVNVRCIFQIKPYSGKVTAKFLSIYIERKVRTGTSVNRALRLVYKYLRKVHHVIGFRIVCSGRFKRGKKKGYVSRSVGVFSYGRFDKKHILDYAHNYSQLKTGICGFKIWLCSSPYIENKNYIDYSDRFVNMI